MEKLSDYLNREIIMRMVNKRDLKALNNTKDDNTIYWTDTSFGEDHNVTKQHIAYLCKQGAEINEVGEVIYPGKKREGESFSIKNYRGI